jgi:hypothetical protein
VAVLPNNWIERSRGREDKEGRGGRYSAFGPLRCAVRAARKPRAAVLGRPRDACVTPLRGPSGRRCQILRRSTRADARFCRRSASPRAVAWGRQCRGVLLGALRLVPRRMLGTTVYRCPNVAESLRLCRRGDLVRGWCVVTWLHSSETRGCLTIGSMDRRSTPLTRC